MWIQIAEAIKGNMEDVQFWLLRKNNSQDYYSISLQ